MMKTLQELSDAQLESVSHIVDEQVKLNENRKVIAAKERALKAKETRKKNKEKKLELLLEKAKEEERNKVSKIVTDSAKDVAKKIRSISKISKETVLSEKNLERLETLKKLNADPKKFLTNKAKDFVKSKMSAKQIDMVRSARSLNEDPFKYFKTSITKKIDSYILKSESKNTKSQ